MPSVKLLKILKKSALAHGLLEMDAGQLVVCEYLFDPPCG